MSKKPKSGSHRPRCRHPRVTRHASKRAVERHACRTESVGARYLSDCFERSIRIPYRYARSLRIHPGLRKPVRAKRADFRVAGQTLLVCRGRTVLTTWRLTDDQFASVLWWTLTGSWLT